jgi:hypothetical protein
VTEKRRTEEFLGGNRVITAYVEVDDDDDDDDIVTGRCHSTDCWLPMSYPR